MEVGKLIERGELLFTKKLSKGVEKNAFTMTLKTPLAVMVLGGTSKVEWTSKLMDQSLISLGLFYSDDIAECLGDVVHKKLVKFIEKKYADSREESK